MPFKIHEVKCIQPWFDDVWTRRKTFEVRFNDRNYEVNELLLLREYRPTSKTYTGKEILCEITYLLNHPQFVLEGFVILQINILRMRL